MGPVPRHALVLTAGLGTRLRPLTLVRAKPALPVAGEPLISRIARWLAGNGVSDLVLNLHHLPATIAAVMGDGSAIGVRVRYSWEQPAVLGSAGGPRAALDIIGAPRFLIVNGDTLTDFNLGALSAAHDRSGALVTLALVPNREPMKYGGVCLDAASRVTGFVPAGSADGSYHFVGIQVAEARAFHALQPGHPVDSFRGAYRDLIAADPGSVRGLVGDASFHDIGTLADYWTTSQALLRSDAAARPNRRDGRVHPTATTIRTILWDDVEVGANAVLEDCIVTDGVVVPAGAVHRRAVLLRSGAGYAAHAF
jgi:NDP-sugar pyrophosphorylase family protein